MLLSPASLGMLATIASLICVERSRLPATWKAAMILLLVWGFPLSLWFL